MSSQTASPDGGLRALTPWSGVAAPVGAVLVLGTPWVREAVLGTRPYLASGFDGGLLVGWALMLVGLAGVHAVFGTEFDLPGRLGAGATAAGMALLAELLFRRVVAFAAAGFRVVPASGEDAAGLLLTLASVLGFSLTLLGAVGLGLALRRVEDPPPVRHVGRTLFGTNAVLVPLGAAWLSLGALVWSRSRAW
jgi:hypothetical protein